MPFRSIILTVLALIVVGALVLLFAEASESPDVDISEPALERARQRHERATTRAPSAAPTTPQTGPMKAWKRPTKTSVTDEETGAARRADTSLLSQSSNLRPEAKRGGRSTLRVPEKTRLGAEPENEDDAEIQARMSDVNRFYDRRDYESALAEAKKILAVKPGNVRMLRVVVSSACIMGDESEAAKHYELLPPRHQQQMERRCSRYGMSFGSSQQ